MDVLDDQGVDLIIALFYSSIMCWGTGSRILQARVPGPRVGA